MIGNQILSTMLFNAFFPVIEWSMFFAKRVFWRWLDQHSCCKRNLKYETKVKSVQHYIDLYSGPIFLMHFRYASILNITFVTMMFGLALPLLFPYAVLSLSILWFSEKLLFFYSYRLPPMYDISMGKNVLKIMQVAPLIMMLFGYWFFSSNQLLKNERLIGKVNQSDTALNGHTFAEVFHKDGWEYPAWPFLMIAMVMLVWIFFSETLSTYLGFNTRDSSDEEEIDTYWNSLNDHDREWRKGESLHFRKMT